MVGEGGVEMAAVVGKRAVLPVPVEEQVPIGRCRPSYRRKSRPHRASPICS